MTERERLIELIKQSLFKHIYKSCNLSENIADDLIANGVIVPPCKVGDMVYDLTFDKVNVYVVEKIKFTYTADGLECEEIYANGKYGILFNLNNIGKTVFLTKEEAEKRYRKAV